MRSFFYLRDSHPLIHGLLQLKTVFQHFLPYQGLRTGNRSRSVTPLQWIQTFQQQKILPFLRITVRSAKEVSFSYSRSLVHLNLPLPLNQQVLHNHLPSHHQLILQYQKMSGYLQSFYPVSALEWSLLRSLLRLPYIH